MPKSADFSVKFYQFPIFLLFETKLRDKKYCHKCPNENLYFRTVLLKEIEFQNMNIDLNVFLFTSLRRVICRFICQN